jgi:hypothetical protein
MRASLLAPDDEKVLNCMGYFAMLLGRQGKVDESEKIFQELVVARSLSLGPEHPQCLRDRYNLCCSQLSKGRLFESGIELRRVLAAQTKAPGAERKQVSRAICSPFRSNSRVMLLRSALKRKELG